jgi:serine protease Do
MSMCTSNPLKFSWLAAVLLLLAQSVSAASAAAAPDFRGIVKSASPAVVNVRTTSTQEASQGGDEPPDLSAIPPELRDYFRHFFQLPPGAQEAPPEPAQGLGSGFILSPDGYILTNAHVVEHADEVVVRLADHRELPAEIVGADARTDVALLKIDASGLPTIPVGDARHLEVGQWVVAIGSPFGLESTATAGIVSAVGRSLPGDTYVPFIQTDVAINPGNSGGPLLDTDGRVVGINSQIFSRTGGYMGLSFAVPIDLATHVASQLKETGHVQHGWLGIQIQPVSQDLATAFGLDRPRGALVAGVTADSPADKAGIEAGDIVLGYDGKPIDQLGDLPALVGNTMPGHQAHLDVLRNGSESKIVVDVGELDQNATAQSEESTSDKTASTLHMTVSDPTASERRQLDLPQGGVVVRSIEQGPAAQAGIREGDVIVTFNRTPVENAEQFHTLVESTVPGKPFALLIHRGDQILYVAVRVPSNTG